MAETIDLQLANLDANAELDAQAANLAASGEQFRTSARSAKRTQCLEDFKVHTPVPSPTVSWPPRAPPPTILMRPLACRFAQLKLIIAGVVAVVVLIIVLVVA